MPDHRGQEAQGEPAWPPGGREGRRSRASFRLEDFVVAGAVATMGWRGASEGRRTLPSLLSTRLGRHMSVDPWNDDAGLKMYETQPHTSSSMPPPPISDSGVPIHRRQTEAFERLVVIERGSSMSDRILSHFLGMERPARQASTLGPLRCGLAWSVFPRFLESEGWSVEGSFGVTPYGSEVGLPGFRRVELGNHESLDIPSNLWLFLSRGPERQSIQFEEEKLGSSVRIAIRVSSNNEDSKLLDHWFESAQRQNPLRGRSLFPSGKTLDRRGLREGEVLFVSSDTRRRLDSARDRFLGSVSEHLFRLGVRRRAGLILAGPPGTGKTSLCRELSGRLDCTFLWVTPGAFEDLADVGETYELARWLEPTVVVLEDLDMIAESRERGNQSRLLGELMNQLDGIAGDHRVLTVATTNRLDVVEEAVRNRPGRFDEIIEIAPPDATLRLGLLRHRFRLCVVDESDLARIAERLDGATGAEIEEVSNRVITASLTRPGAAAERPVVSATDLDVALSDVRHRPRRPVPGFGGETSRI